MIVTLTPNPAWDVSYRVDELAPGTTHRVREVHGRAGGKGVNVARVLHQLGVPTLVVAPVGGSVGELLRADLAAAGIGHGLLDVSGTTRTTVAVVSDDDATLFNEPGAPLGEERWRRLTELIGARLPTATALVCSGSLPSGTDPARVADLVGAARRHAVPVLVDTSGPALLTAAEAGADVLKPNAAELARATGHDDALRGARELRAHGAGAVVVSRGPDGMLAATGDGGFEAVPPHPVHGNPTGAGDAAVAALAAGFASGAVWPELLSTAVAWSAAAVAAPVAGAVDTRTLAEVTGTVTVRELGP